jgi:cell wall-associated NlpC family hydrolase
MSSLGADAPRARTATAPALRGRFSGAHRAVRGGRGAVALDGGGGGIEQQLSKASADFAGHDAAGAPRRMLDVAAGQLGQHEMPMGSNDSPSIAMYREATRGAGVGPWCAYFVSWVAREAGTPLGDAGEGYGSVDALWAWAQQSGHALPAGDAPRPGDLIVWDEHVGIVEHIGSDGTIHTIEGNTSDRVARRVHTAAGVVGFVRLS